MGLMSMGQFKEIVDTLRSTVYLMNFYNWGEPLLHPQVYDMIRYAHDNRIYTSVSTNFNIKFDEDTARRMIESGLDYLYLSIDGASQDTYAQYRRGGNFNDVIRNMEILLRIRKKLAARQPFVEWRFLVFKHNEHDVAAAHAMAAQMGVDKIGVEGGTTENMSDRKGAVNESLLPSEKRYQKSYHFDDNFCDWLWRNVTINWDGSVSACCLSYKKDDDFGVFNKESFMKIWNNDKFSASRMLFDSGRGCKAGTLCDSCYKVANSRKKVKVRGRELHS
jgi:MoaA/NifB/PqqE/SkfB family radical SAM enzyme